MAARLAKIPLLYALFMAGEGFHRDCLVLQKNGHYTRVPL